MHIHLDAVGGISGDMFAAAMLDAYPGLEADVRDALAAMRDAAVLDFTLHAHSDHGLAGHRFEVREPARHTQHAAHWADIRGAIERASLDAGTRDRALDIFARLAAAEARVHGIGVDEVHFHEVGAWDSIADIVAAARLIERCGARTGSVSALPTGRGRVRAAHGSLPVPAPATLALLQGFVLVDDGLEGERVTPTGAAILAHLGARFGMPAEPARLVGTGSGFGRRRFESLANLLRVVVMEPVAGGGRGRVAVVRFEVDDQTPEDLSVALERLRRVEGIHDVLQVPAFGKKGRMVSHIPVLVRPEALDAAIDACFTETTTLGLRWDFSGKAAVGREMRSVSIDGARVDVKLAKRPGGSLTGKAELDHVAPAPGGHAGRARLRGRAERAALSPGKDSDE